MTERVGQVPECLQLTIAGIRFDLSWEGARLEDEPSLTFYLGFLSNGDRGSRAAQIEVRLRVHCGELPEVKPEALIFDARSNLWRLFRLNGQYVMEFFDTKPPHPRIQLAVMTPDFSQGEVFRRPDKTVPEPSWSLTYLMRPFGELVLINLLSQGRGVLLHALGVSDRGEGLLFVGRSGSGKTTLADLYKPHQDVTILGDERVVVTKADGQFWLSGTPWPGEGFTVSADTVPLRKVFFLEHATQNVLLSDRLINLHGLFFQQLFLPVWNGKALAFALEFGEELLSRLPVHRLAFVNDSRVIEFLRNQT